jgi:tRNA (mo5U34)-methyltransferase
VEERYLQQACWAAEHYGLAPSATFEHRKVYDLARSEVTYDRMVFMGVFYHLRYPLLALDIVSAKVIPRLLVFQTLTMPGEDVDTGVQDRQIDDRVFLLEPGWPTTAFIEHCFAGDPTNWWIPNPSAIAAMIRARGLRASAQPGHEISLCEPDSTTTIDTRQAQAAQVAAAIGRTSQR